MLQIEKKLVMDEDQTPIAVQIDFDTFQVIERILEDYGLGKFMEDVKAEPSLELGEAQAQYSTDLP